MKCKPENMKLKSVNHRPIFDSNCNLATAFQKVQTLIESLNRHHLPQEVAEKINEEILAVDNIHGTEKEMVSRLNQIEKRIISLVSTRLGLVPEKHYKNIWLPLGMIVFGLPLGTLLFLLTGNAAFIGIGLPLGMAIGIFLGMALDKRADNQNKVLKAD